jgi:1,4-alpha-glucan branching enzyme
MWAHPGKKLLFMGGEIGQQREWNHDASWTGRWPTSPTMAGLQRLVGDLNRVYRAEGALHHTDADPRGFSWIAENHDQDGVFVFERRSFHGGAPMIVAVNMTPEPRHGRSARSPSAGPLDGNPQHRRGALWRRRPGQRGGVDSTPRRRRPDRT